MVKIVLVSAGFALGVGACVIAIYRTIDSAVVAAFKAYQ